MAKARARNKEQAGRDCCSTKKQQQRQRIDWNRQDKVDSPPRSKPSMFVSVQVLPAKSPPSKQNLRKSTLVHVVFKIQHDVQNYTVYEWLIWIRKKPSRTPKMLCGGSSIR